MKIYEITFSENEYKILKELLEEIINYETCYYPKGSSKNLKFLEILGQVKLADYKENHYVF